ncbi:DUF4011 domain-containing protein, partial [Arthrobacter sp. Br18]|uniref:DUF4011 domain-containing protein n=1 Tax=Arthrobacter sp. Br18 TaxID=1312954 RepID=UPI0012DFDEAD
MELTNREVIGRALDILSSGLEPFIRTAMAQAAPGVEWTRVLEHKDDLEHRESKLYRATDPQVQLRMLTERLGTLGFPFNLTPEARAYAGEMRQVRNLWAHNEPFTDDDVQRYLDTTARLLHSIGVDPSAEQIRSVLQEYRITQPICHSSAPNVEEAEESPAPELAAAESDEQPQPLPHADVSMSFEASADLSYVMAYNGRRIVSRLTVTNGGAEIRGAVLKLSITGNSGTVSRPLEHYLDLPAGEAVTIAEPDLLADPAPMLQLQDRQHGTVHARLEADGELIAEQSNDIELFAAHHWVYRPGLLSLESLAAFVQPNHPAIATLCSEASDLLKATTGSGSLQGYQAGPERVDAVAEALVTAMKNPAAESDEQPQPLPHADVSMSFEASADLSYVMAYNGRRIVSRLTVTNGGAEIRGAVLKLSITGNSGTVSRPLEHYLDLPAGEAVTIAEPDLLADPAPMLQLQDRQHGTVHARLEADGELIAEQSNDIELFAAHHWVYRPGLLSLESLAAFVQPNHPAIATLCSEASDLLKATTGSGSLQGYQAGPERVDAVAEALVTAMKNRSIRYSEPPASWGQQAQRIRTAEEVLGGRFGTCLDTVVVLAAALEFAGLQANLWLVHGHIFLGYWRDEANFKTPALEEPALLVNAIDLERIRLVETTLITNSADTTMQELHDRPYARWLTGELDEVLGVVDIYGARHTGVLPIPARVTDANGQVSVIEYTPARQEAPATAPMGTPTRSPRPQRPDMPPRVSQWKNALLDLSLRNRLINFTKTARFPLAVPDARVGQFEDLINSGATITLLPSDDVSAMQADRGIRFGRDLPQDQLADILVSRKAVFADVTADAYQTRMRNLAYKARTLVEETGANNLYLALGSLVWSLDGKELRSPLVLVPARLRPTTKQGAYQISLDDAGTSTPNYCLLEKLRLTLGLEIPGLAEPLEDDSGIDLHAAFDAVRRAIAEKNLPFRVEPTVDLSILQFAKFRLWKDLDEHWELLSTNPLVNHLVHTPTETFVDPVPAVPDVDLDQLAASTPIPADSSQLQAIAEAVAERTFVLEGPPGTGKSQTITNLLTRAIAEGKRVLFVAEKRAALDVVQKRLDEVGMGVFSLDLHDKASKPSAVRQQIRLALDHVVDPDRQGLDAALGELHNARRGLVRYAARLHEDNGAELSLYTARTQELAVGDEVPPLPIPEAFAEGVSLPLLQQLRSILAELPEVAEPAAANERHPWGFIDDPLDAKEAAAVGDAAKRLQAALEQLPVSEELFKVLLSARTPAELATLAALLRVADVDMDVLDEANTARWAEATRTLGAQLAAFLAASHPGLDRVVPEALDLPIADLHAQAVTAAESGFFGRKKRLLAVGEQFAAVTRPGVEIKAKDVPELTGALLAVQGAVRGLAGGAADIPGIVLPASWNPFTPAGQQLLRNNVQWLEWAAALV